MGILYFARNPETKQAYELGKGHWFKLASPDGVADCSDYDRVLRVITDEIIREPLWAKEAVEDPGYHQEIARALVALGPSLEIVDDTTWDDPVDGYEMVGSRYRDD
jgi:hypothetical protein